MVIIKITSTHMKDEANATKEKEKDAEELLNATKEKLLNAKNELLDTTKEKDPEKLLNATKEKLLNATKEKLLNLIIDKNINDMLESIEIDSIHYHFTMELLDTTNDKLYDTQMCSKSTRMILTRMQTTLTSTSNEMPYECSPSQRMITTLRRTT